MRALSRLATSRLLGARPAELSAGCSSLRRGLLGAWLALLLSSSPSLHPATAILPPPLLAPTVIIAEEAGSAEVSQASSAEVSEASSVEISYSDLKGLLNQCIDGSSDVCKVDRVDFKDALGETAEATVEGRALFVVGIPKDNPNNDSSPYKLVAKLRDAKVPFTFPFARALKTDAATSTGDGDSSSTLGLPRLPALPTLPTLPKLPF